MSELPGTQSSLGRLLGQRSAVLGSAVCCSTFSRPPGRSVWRAFCAWL